MILLKEKLRTAEWSLLRDEDKSIDYRIIIKHNKMKKFYFLLIVTFLSVMLKAQEPGKYFFVKSGYIEYELTGNTKGKKQIWFDEYGLKMHTLTESETTIKILGIKNVTKEKKLEIRKGNELWILDLLTNTGTKTTIDYAIEAGKAITNNKTDIQLHETEKKILTDIGAKIEGYETFMDKKCLVFTWGTNKFWQYKGIPLRSEVAMKGLIANSEVAVIFKENTAVPSEKFNIPSGIKIETVQNPLD